MPEMSIVITAQDNYSDAVKRMAEATRLFRKTQEEMQQDLDRMTRNQAELQNELRKSRTRLHELEKQCDETGDATSEALLVAERANYNNINRNLTLVKKGSRELEKQMLKTGDAFSLASNRAERAGGGMSDVLKAFAASGLSQMAGQLVEDGLGMWVTSRLGVDGGTIFSGALSSAISGATVGYTMGGAAGAAIGAVAGGVLGGITGEMQNKQKKDEAFKSYVQEQTEGAIKQRDEDIQAGSAIAAGRESDLRGLTAMLGGDQATAEAYQRSMLELGRTPALSYDAAMSLSKDMLGLGLSTEETETRLRSLADAAAALNLSESQASAIVSTLESAQASGKMESQTVKSLSKMGIDVYQALGEEFGLSAEEAAARLPELDADRAIEAVYAYMGRSFAGAAQELTDTYAGAKGVLESRENDMKAAYGEGYNDERVKGMNEQSEWLSGASGEAQEEANKALGAWKASLENAKERYIRDAVTAAMESDEYQQAKAEGDAAAMGRMIAAAKSQGNSEYMANEGKEQELADQIALADAIRTDPATMAAYETAGYTMGQVFSKGIMSAIQETAPKVVLPQRNDDGALLDYEHMSAEELMFYATPHAAGLKRVPYDGYAALLHEGERVLTAREARQADAGGNVVVNVSGNQFAVRTDADIPAIAQALAEEIELRLQAGTY